MAKTAVPPESHVTKASLIRSRSRGLTVLFFVLIVLVVGLTVWSISYNWQRQTGKSEANVFNLIKDRLSNINLPSR